MGQERALQVIERAASPRPSTVVMAASRALADRHQAGADLLAVHQHGAGAAIAGIAADLGPGQTRNPSRSTSASRAQSIAADNGARAPLTVSATASSAVERRAVRSSRQLRQQAPQHGQRRLFAIVRAGAHIVDRGPAAPDDPASTSGREIGDRDFALQRRFQRRQALRHRRAGTDRDPRLGDAAAHHVEIPAAMTMEMTRYLRAPSLTKALVRRALRLRDQNRGQDLVRAQRDLARAQDELAQGQPPRTGNGSAARFRRRAPGAPEPRPPPARRCTDCRRWCRDSGSAARRPRAPPPAGSRIAPAAAARRGWSRWSARRCGGPPAVLRKCREVGKAGEVEHADDVAVIERPSHPQLDRNRCRRR